MRLAVLFDAIGEGLHAPIFALGDAAAVGRDDILELIGQGIQLLSGEVLTRKIDMLVKRHE